MKKEIIQNIDDYCSTQGITRAEFERRCKLSNGMVGSWDKGKYTPGLKSIKKIIEHTHIPLEDWFVEGGVKSWIRSQETSSQKCV